MLVSEALTGDPDVRSFRSLPWRAADRPLRALDRLIGLQYVGVPSTLALLAHPWLREADIVQLYNLHGGHLSQLVLPLLARGHVLVYRLSDMWALTGHCAYSYGCERWRIGCGRCPHLDDYPSLARDTTALNFRLKRALYERTALHVVAPSSWTERLARESPLLGRYPVTRIPNGVDLATFRPQDRGGARRELGLPCDRPVILFGGTEARKGGALLAQTVGALRETTAGRVIVISVGVEQLTVPGIETRALGAIRDDRRMALAYAAADLFVLPTVADNLPNTVLESMACGTPVASFDVGGVSDAVRHLDTGWLAPAADAAGLAVGVARLMADAALRGRLGHRGREIAVAEYSLELQAGRFAALYRALVPGRASSGGGERSRQARG